MNIYSILAWIDISWQASAASVLSLALLHNGDLACGDNNGVITIWRPYDGILVRTINAHTSSVRRLLVLQSSELVSASGDNEVKVWNTFNGLLSSVVTQTNINGHTDQVRCLALLSNGDFASGSYDNKIKIWSKTNGTCLQTLTGHTGWIFSLALLSTGELASSSWDQSIKIWRLEGSSYILNRTFSMGTAVRSIIKLQSGDLVAGLSTNFKVLNSNNGTTITNINAHTDHIYDLALLSNGTFASASYDGKVKLWNPPVITPYKTFTEVTGTSYDCFGVITLPNSGLATACSDGKIRIHNLG